MTSEELYAKVNTTMKKFDVKSYIINQHCLELRTAANNPLWFRSRFYYTKRCEIKNYKDIKEFVKGTIAENSIIIPCSAQQEMNSEKVLE
jgi:SepF-like predicted cell division protein (DUF552 family)